MSKEYHSKTMRDARAKAKILSKTTVLSHQQALDVVARDNGHRNWSAMTAAENGTTTAKRSETPRKVNRSRLIHESNETEAIEDAVAIARRVPAWALPFIPALMSMLWIMVFAAPLVSVRLAILLACTSGVIISAAAIVAARHPVSGIMVSARRRMATIGKTVGWSVVAAAGLVMVAAPIVIMSGDQNTIEGVLSHLGTAMASGVTIINTGVYAQKAMAIASPASIRPSKHAAPDEIGIPKRLTEIMRIGVVFGLAAAIIGVTVLMGAAVASLFTHVPRLLMGGSIVAMGLGIAAAMGSITVMMALRYRMDDGSLRDRATRAQRLIKASR